MAQAGSQRGVFVVVSPLVDRRRFCRLAGAAALLASGGALAACARAVTGRSAHPRVSQPGITIVFSPWTAGDAWNSTIITLMQETLASFERQNPGVRVQLVQPAGGCCNPAALTAAMVAGTAPDVLLNNNFGSYAAGGYFLPLDPYLQRDNIAVSIWSSQQIQSFRGWSPVALLALPVYFNTTAYMVNLSAFDAAGLGYPDPQWTYAEFTRTAQALSSSTGTSPRYGCNLWFWTEQAWGSDWIFRAFKGAKVGPGSTTCALGEQPSLDAADWIYHEIFWPKVGTAQNTFGGYNAQFTSGRTVMSVQQTGSLLTAVTDLVSNNMKWDIYPFPVFPAGRAAFGGDQFYALSARTKHPDQAWSLLKWLTVGTEWQRAMIKLFLMAPALNSLWPEWETIVQAVAPPLKGKAIQWFSDAAVHGYAYPTSYFRYMDAEAETIIQNYFGGLFARKYTVRTALTQAAQQVDVLETSSAGGAAPSLQVQQAALAAEKRRLQGMFSAG